MTSAQRVAATIAAALSACAVAAPVVIQNEGWRLKSYPDPVAISTVCAGVTAGVRPNTSYTDAQCQIMTSQALVQHALDIAPCLPETLPTESRAAFVSFGYNVGAAKFCASTVAKKARAGDLAGACAGLSAWVYAGGRVLPGLVERRKAERALCMKGLK